MNTSNDSLRLIEILSQEFAELHGEPVLRPVSEKLGFPKAYVETVLSEEDGKKETPFRIFRKEKLESWLASKGFKDHVRAESYSGRFIEEKDKTLKALQWQIKDPYFIYKEEWVTDAPLRAFTRGLLEEYKEDYPKPKRMSRKASSPESSDLEDPGEGMVLANGFPGDLFGFSGRKKRLRNAQEQQIRAEKLNRLLMEDIFPEYLPCQDDEKLTTLYKDMFEKGTSALSLSGGGIRSGTFALGIVQGLAQLGINPKLFTYLSSVSGGGYLAGWLTAWIHQAGADSVFDQLKPKAAYPLEPAPIRHLRSYSNYLSPLVGLFSADTWTLFSIYVRNLLINWMIIIPFLAGFSVIPWVMVTLFNVKPDFAMVKFCLIAGMIMLMISDGFTKRHPPIIQNEGNYDPNLSWQDRNQGNFILYCLLPGAMAIFLWTLGWYWFFYGEFPEASERVRAFHSQIRSEWNGDLSWYTIVSFAGMSLIFVVIEWIVFLVSEKLLKIIPARFTTEKSRKARWVEFGCLLIAGSLFGILVITVAHMIQPLNNFRNIIPIVYTCLAFPVFLMVILFNGFIFEGLKSKFVEDAEREWTARYSAWFLIVCFVWAFVSGIILYGPVLANNLFKYFLTAGAITSYLTAYLGQKLKGSGKPETMAGKDDSASSKSLSLLALAALVILFILLSFMDIGLISKAIDLITGVKVELTPESASKVSIWYAIAVLSFMVIACLVFALIIDVNRFSLHGLYRSRLIRAYLGASRPQGVRRPDPFTGFDETDNIFMGDLVKKENQTIAKPFHIVNMALNLVSGNNLAWQERMATSFTVSPLHSGSSTLGYRKTYMGDALQEKGYDDKKGKFYGGDRGISLGTAITISGAAASPSSGYHTSSLVAFFMTLFNLRLGWWLGNPGPAGNGTFSRSSPRWGLKPVLSEMFGLTNELNPYVLLSDGGHFENLGLYEMVRRRNRFVLLSDASCDETCNLEDLGNAIRKIRIDMGITIDFPHGFDIYARKNPAASGGKYWALGRIRYPESGGTPDAASTKFGPNDGILLYIKPGIYGNEPKDIYNYASANTTFPHESTADQFFSESQFESYRALGVFAMNQADSDLRARFSLSVSDLISADAGEWQRQIIPKVNRVTPPTTLNRFGRRQP